VTIDELNALDRQPFVDAIGWVFEHSPWVAERVWGERPFTDVETLHSRMTAVVGNAARDEQFALVAAHPDLGTRARLSDASAGEQQGAGLDRLNAEQFERLQRLNAAYKARFGFPFLYAVKGSTASQILDALEQRLPNDVEQEFSEALRQVARIARFRLDDLFAR
jgi:2-oxo-4-hydroxy-4-carboxy-5-ureidoimidazoline decarboxylase